MKSHKVFCIGFHKTGTSSLTVALRQLGYAVTGPNGVNDPDIAHTAWGMVQTLSYSFDAFQDNPWPLFFRNLDELHPDSRFILTMRDPNAWIESVVKHFGGKSTPMREWIYGHGDPRGHEASYMHRYERHNREVMEYFSSRPADLLLIRLEDVPTWTPLCQFLREDEPVGPFPHVNRAAERTRWKGVKSVAQRLLGQA